MRQIKSANVRLLAELAAQKTLQRLCDAKPASLLLEKVNLRRNGFLLTDESSNYACVARLRGSSPTATVQLASPAPQAQLNEPIETPALLKGDMTWDKQPAWLRTFT
jgi:hypothetical protein